MPNARLLAMDGFIVLVSFVEVSGIPWSATSEVATSIFPVGKGKVPLDCH